MPRLSVAVRFMLPSRVSLVCVARLSATIPVVACPVVRARSVSRGGLVMLRMMMSVTGIGVISFPPVPMPRFGTS